MSTLVIELLRQVEGLTPAQQLDLAMRVMQMAQAQLQHQDTHPRRKWREIAGAATEPLLGEDAQAWVSRTRAGSDESRSAVFDQP